MVQEDAAAQLVREYWQRMQTNDFAYAAQLLAEDYVLDWPQSGERLRGRENFTRMNAEYPAHGKWRFTLNRLVSDGREVVSDVSVTDGVLSVRAITFSTVDGGQIVSQLEYWPEPFPAPPNRAHLVERMPA
ncbi:nuclear transport factor 2 family protein [Parachitinimonas caeni]|uniref:Nuclear transport factor 2 family protein n=1 Tax=Parachitinimonas caeni TaxID=3031301 RepID=A0ABT7E174_9NEIS|nr:nuclear transport factor 2 family protein [Parachitinimonas caeni]MDK2125999.1 nuclear transport factor 2 family protein [Parachitinimonas caeni]